MSDESKKLDQTAENCEGDRQSQKTISNQSAKSTSSSSSNSNSISGGGNGVDHHKLHTKAARSRNFIVGAVGHQQSILGDEELSKCLPSGQVTILIVTWNMGGREGPSNFNEILLPENVDFVPEIYAIGTQETPSNASDFRVLSANLQATIGPSHVLLHWVSMGVLHLFIFIRRDLIWFVSVPEDSVYHCRSKATNMVKTKGALCISFALFGTTLLFINCHLPAHASRNQERLDEYARICRSLDLPRNLRPLRPGYESNDVTSRFDCVFWFGDLNFRIEQKYTDALKMLTRASLTSFEVLLDDDQLSKALNKGDIFYGFKEAKAIKFAPTYKYRIGSDGFDILSERVPSYTDRILFRSKRKNEITCLSYDCVSSIKTSDHKPVYALMEVKIKSGRDDVPLNAGAFRRDVYLDGLKRQAQEYPDIIVPRNSNSSEAGTENEKDNPSTICRIA